MSNIIVKIATYAFLIGSLLIMDQPAHAQVAETLSHLKDKACSSTGAAVAVGLWCCGVTSWCLNVHKNQRKLEIDNKELKSLVETEQQKRRTLKKELKHMNELVQSHSAGLLECEKNFKNRVGPLESALYGTNADDTKRAFRLTVLSKFMEAQSSVTVKAYGRIDAFDSSESFANSGQESSPVGEGLRSPRSREGSVSSTSQEKTDATTMVLGSFESKPSTCSLM